MSKRHQERADWYLEQAIDRLREVTKDPEATAADVEFVIGEAVMLSDRLDEALERALVRLDDLEDEGR